MIVVELSQIAFCSPLVGWAFTRYVLHPARTGIVTLDSDGSLTYKGNPVTLPPYTDYITQYDWWITQEVRKGELTRAKAQHKRATDKVYSHEANTVADAVYLCMVERRKRSSVVSVPDRYINEFLGWEL